MNEQLIEMRIKAEKKMSYTNGFAAGFLFGVAIVLIFFFVFSF